MVKIRILSLSLLLSLLSGCVLLDVSLLEDALPREQGDWEIEPYYSSGMPYLSSITPIWYASEAKSESLGQEKNPFAYAMMGFAYLFYASTSGVRAGYAVTPNTQIAGRVYVSGLMGVGGKLGVKQVLWQKTNASRKGELPRQTFLAVQPSLNLLLPGWTQNNPSEGKIARYELTSLGAESQLLLSTFKDPARVTTFGVRVNYEYVRGYKPDDGSVSQVDAGHIGIALNSGYEVGKLTWVPGCGIDLSYNREEGFFYWPFVSMGARFEL